VLLVEAARQALARALVQPLLSENGGLRVVTLDRALEEELGRLWRIRAKRDDKVCRPHLHAAFWMTATPCREQ